MSLSASPATVNVAKCQACHAKRRSMLPSATPATQTAAASTASTKTQGRYQSQSRAISATLATQSARRWPRAMPATQKARPCRQVPHRMRKSMSPSATLTTQTAAASTASTGTQARHQSKPSAISATLAMRRASCVWTKVVREQVVCE